MLRCVFFLGLFALAGCAGAGQEPCELDCGEHGRCALRAGMPVCVCEPGYVAGSAGCEPDACADFLCVHGTCESEGGAHCECEPGYAGEHCDACAEGYRAEGLFCVPASGCDVIDCVHGQCRLDGQGNAYCECDPGYDGTSCEHCAAGYHAVGLRCEPNSACDPDPCVRGACFELDGQAVCECESGYAGEYCQRCAAGYVPDGLRCVPESAYPCEPNPCDQVHRTLCVPESDGGHRCDCDPGYHDELGTCVPTTACSPNPCASLHRTACVLVEDGYRCDCDPGWHDESGECVPDTTCDPASTCSGHGACTGAGLECACFTGYAGAHCERCASGYHEDASGDCVPSTACEPNPCTTVGQTQCREQGSGFVCDCDPGYQDEDGDGRCRPGCELAGLSCPTHAHCEDGTGVALCVCDEGYRPEGAQCVSTDPCEPNPCTGPHRSVCMPSGDGHVCACDPGFQDADGDGLCLPDCTTAGLDCGPNAHCAVAGGQAACRCDAGYQDADGDGLCLPSCATAGLDCEPGTICDDSSGQAQCVAGTRPPIYIAFLWHMHQPIYWPYESIAATEAAGRMGFSVYTVHLDRTGPYTTWPRDAIAAGLGLDHLGAQVSFSGSLMENLNNMAAAGAGFSGWTGAWSEAMGWQTVRGNPRLDLVRFGYHHPLMGLVDTVDIRMQLALHAEAARRVFGTTLRSRGIFPPECAFSARMIPALVAEGVEWVLVDNIHFDRAHVDYPYRPESNLPPPNRADRIDSAPTSWVQLDGLWAPSPVSAPWGYQPHWVEHCDPATGQTQRIIAVPAARYEGNEDARGGFGALQYEQVLSQYEHLNTDPAHPMLVVLHHDGDNYGGGTESYYHGNFQAFVAWAAGQPDRFVPTTIQDYLDRFPPDPDDVIHVEDGAWSGADNGDPEFHKWNGDPDANGHSPDRHSWAVITATSNRVRSAQAILPSSSISAVLDAAGNDTDKAWHYLLNAETSCYWYWDNSAGGIWDSHPTRAANQACVYADRVLASGPDTLGPSIYLPQREPYNPGLTGTPRDFEVWTLVYDLSGLAQVRLHWRVDADGVRDSANDLYAGGAWSQVPMAASELSSSTDPLPAYKAAQYAATVSGVSEALVDYYVSAEDMLGHTTRSPIRHVWVGAGSSAPQEIWEPAEPGANDVIAIRWHLPGMLHWGVDASLHGGTWGPPPAEYWPAGTVEWTDGLAVESPLQGPDGQGRYTIELGPFDGTPVAEIDFVFHHADGSWSSPDQVIPIAQE